MLTYIQINAAKPRAKAWNLSDSQGLYLVVQPDGSKLWAWITASGGARQE